MTTNINPIRPTSISMKQSNGHRKIDKSP
uniref:Uncharacterized protein n=1 Tax=Rhizophora mucronata TaxID=61149 RepID=A0A2P2QIY5_RHIMU